MMAKRKVLPKHKDLHAINAMLGEPLHDAAEKWRVHPKNDNHGQESSQDIRKALKKKDRKKSV